MLRGQSLHTNSFDEALALPTEQAAKLALRTQQVLALETGVSNVADSAAPYFVEALTAELESRAAGYLERIEAMGGAIAAIERGFFQDEMYEAAFRLQQAVESGERAIVGVNRFEEPEERPRRDPADRRGRGRPPGRAPAARSRGARRDGRRARPRRRGAAARGTGNLLPRMREALRAAATVGEVSDVLRRVFGVHRPTV